MEQSQLELISNHRTVEENLVEIKLYLHYSSTDKKAAIENEIKVLEAMKSQIEDKLLKTLDNTIAEIKKGNLLSVMRIIIDNLKLNPGGHPISRDQGTVIHNAIYGYIIYDLKSAFNSDYGGYSIPRYYHQIGGTFEHKIIKSMLESKFAELRDRREENYLTLKEFVEQLEKSIRQMAEVDDGYDPQIE